jgi:hypothetical protein
MTRRMNAGPATPRPEPRPLSDQERQRRLEALLTSANRPPSPPACTAWLPTTRRPARPETDECP